MKLTFSSDFHNKFKKPELVVSALTKIAYGTLNQMRKLTPVVTGNLRRSESFGVDRDKVAWGATADYAQKIEDRSNYLKGGLAMQKENIMGELGKAFEGNMK